MNKYEKELMQHALSAEEKELRELKKIYRQALAEIDDNIAKLLGRADADMQHVIYRVDYQRALKGQISGILDAMNSKQFESITQYMAECYDNGFVGTAYSMAKQGVPLMLPIDQKQVVKALRNDSKISGSLYTKLGEDTDVLKKRISSSVSRGIATGKGYGEIARDIEADSNIGFNKAVRIARTEGARVHNSASYDAAVKAKEKGADVVKQWNSTLDANTRTSHQHLDGQIRELDEKFSNGLMYPCDPAGSAGEVINCRCSLLQRAKWALDEDELQTLQERAAYFELDKSENFDDFKEKYLKALPLAEFKFQSAPNAGNTTTIRMTVMKAMARTSKAVQAAMKNTTVMVGIRDMSAYDYNKDVMYIAKTATETEVLHEVGHMIDAKLIDKKELSEYKNKLFENITASDIMVKIRKTKDGTEVPIFVIAKDNFVSEYQGRLYVDDIMEAFDNNGKLNTDRMLEIVSEGYREYMENPENLKAKDAELFGMIEKVIKDDTER